MARLIKRYGNRKLYDVTERRYITLDEISELVQNNEEIQVMDKVSGEDITEHVLSKVVAFSAHQPEGPLPKNVLVSLIQRPSDAFMGYVRKTVSAGFETMSQLDRLAKTLRDMVLRSENGTGPETDELAPALKTVIEGFVQECVQARLAEMNLPQKVEIERLRQQVRTLERQVRALQSSNTESTTEVLSVAAPKRSRASVKQTA